MSERILITGGAGFIGSHVARRLLAGGDRVRVLDSLIDQVHRGAGRPDYLEPDAELIVGDVRDPDAVARALEDVDAVIHLAARVGVGQSMYEMAEYASVNTHGTGVLLQAMMERPVRKLVVASSMSIYGEGLYRGAGGTIVGGTERPREQLEAGRWELADADGPLEPVPTDEGKRPELSSHYALGKYDQERMCLLFGSAYRVPAVALRFFNVYGPDQALSNPYTGVLAIFSSRLLHGRPPLIFEDGGQRRDFVHVRDVAQACTLALAEPGADGQAINVGCGASVSILEIARRLGDIIGCPLEPEISGRYRIGDIRHCFADIGRIRALLGYEPTVDLDAGLADLAEWLEGQEADDHVDSAAAELAARGLTL
jgi:dTDP-L-rhamnose 4-epimerase